MLSWSAAIIYMFFFFLKVKDTTPTGITCLDDALFKQIKKHQDKSPEKPKKVQDYFEKEVCIWKDKSEKSCAYKALDDLVDQGILDKKKKFFGMKYPTIQPGTSIKKLAGRHN